MATLYFKLRLPVVIGFGAPDISPGIYKREEEHYNRKDGRDQVPTRFMDAADCIWLEDKTGVTYIKNRFLGAPAVDTEEFMWVKLQAKAI